MFGVCGCMNCPFLGVLVKSGKAADGKLYLAVNGFLV